MIENRRRPGGCVVTVVALLAGRDMRRRLARRLHAVMAGVAITRHRCVVHKRDSAPCGSDMAVGTLGGRHYVISRLGRGAHDAAR